MTGKPAIRITYCTQCNWLLRSGWMAQELLSTFGPELAEVTLVPGTGGVFEILCDGETIWERKRDGGFPDSAELKRRVRDKAWPEKQLGHVEKTKHGAADSVSRVRRPHGAPERVDQENGMVNVALVGGSYFDRYFDRPRADI